MYMYMYMYIFNGDVQRSDCEIPRHQEVQQGASDMVDLQVWGMLQGIDPGDPTNSFREVEKITIFTTVNRQSMGHFRYLC